MESSTALDHPEEPGRCLVLGTGLTHFGSSRERDAIHGSSAEQEPTDSIKMFHCGVEAGRPEPELKIDPDFQSVPGRVTIVRNGREHWSQDIRTGEQGWDIHLKTGEKNRCFRRW